MDRLPAVRNSTPNPLPRSKKACGKKGDMSTHSHGSGESSLRYWIAPVANLPGRRSPETVMDLVGKHRIFAISETNFLRKKPHKGDRICFYASGVGVVADAELAAEPRRTLDMRLPNPKKYCFAFTLGRVRTYGDKPVVLDPRLRSRLRALSGGDSLSWAWFVHNFHGVSEDDFRLLTNIEPS